MVMHRLHLGHASNRMVSNVLRAAGGEPANRWLAVWLADVARLRLPW
jgi:hypothetical protein